jgi:hypothetical protein
MQQFSETERGLKPATTYSNSTFVQSHLLVEEGTALTCPTEYPRKDAVVGTG